MTTALASPLFRPPEEGPLLRRALLAAVAVELLVIGNMAFFFRQEKPAPEPAEGEAPSPSASEEPTDTGNQDNEP